ncbi:hypothetical protein [Burkholderia stabilis]|nr:hypothetical protein [Burkholderia stabilis]
MTIMLVETVDINAHIAENPAFRPPPWFAKKVSLIRSRQSPTLRLR